MKKFNILNKTTAALSLLILSLPSYAVVKSNTTIIETKKVKGSYFFYKCESDGFDSSCENIGSKKGYTEVKLKEAINYCSGLSRWNNPGNIFLKSALGSGGFFIGITIGAAVTAPSVVGAIPGAATGASMGSAVGVFAANKIIKPIDSDQYKVALLFIKKIEKEEEKSLDIDMINDISYGLNDFFKRADAESWRQDYQTQRLNWSRNLPLELR